MNKKIVDREIRYHINGTLVDVVEFNDFLSFLREEDLYYTYSEYYSYDLIEFNLNSRLMDYDRFQVLMYL